MAALTTACRAAGHHGAVPDGDWIDELERRAAPGEPQVAQVVLLNYPVSLGAAQNERTNDLLREFALMALSGVHPDAAPALARLERLAGDMVTKYGDQLAEPAAELQRALAAREPTTVLRYALLPVTRTVILDYARMMEEIDAYCLGAALITLQPAPDIYALRRWTVEEFVRQYDGAAPRPWPGGTTDGARATPV